MTNPLVTVFMPVYNSEKYLKDSMESILNQTYKNIELLLVDDGSTDSSISIINSFDDNRIRLIKNEENKGIPFTRNVGLKESNGKYLAIMDSDDIAMPNRIESQVSYLEKNTNVDALGSYYVKFTNKKERKMSFKFTQSEDVKIMLLFFTPISNPSAMVRMSTVHDKKLKYNEEFFVSQDYEFWAQLSKVGNIEILEEYLLKYRTGHENITKVSKKEKLKKRNKLISRIHNDLLSYYGINLNEDEQFVYNQLFSQNPDTISNINDISKIVNKLKEWAKQNNLFEHNRFIEILDENLRIGISNQNLSTFEKIKVYNHTVTSRKAKDLLFIIAKDMYYKMK